MNIKVLHGKVVRTTPKLSISAKIFVVQGKYQIPLDTAFNKLTIGDFKEPYTPLRNAEIQQWEQGHYDVPKNTTLRLFIQHSDKPTIDKTIIVGGDYHKVVGHWHEGVLCGFIYVVQAG
jgi:hypothetical protein